MNPWAMRALDLAVALIAGAGLVLILVAVLARRPSFADRVAQGRVQERAPSAIAAWARRVSASALDSLGSTSESVARRLALARVQALYGRVTQRQHHPRRPGLGSATGHGDAPLA